jgi:hypothetical protein
MHGETAIRKDDLRELLRVVSRRTQPAAAFLREGLPDNCLELAMRIRGVEGYEPGIYRWSPDTDSIVPAPGGELGIWQSTYAMTNYNIDEAACILFVLGDLRKVVERYGARGYRILNAYVGIVAQSAYVAAAAMRLDCGAVLGVRAQHVKQTLMLESNWNVFLAVYLSQAQTPVELFTFHLVPDVPIWKPAH